MPIVAADIKIYLSGGAANSNVNASLGGAKSSVELVDNNLHNLFDVVGSAEAAAGDTEYRLVYVENTHGTLTLQSAKVWLQSQSAVPLAIALGGEGVNGTAETVANEDTAPSGESFSSPTVEGSALSFGDMAAGEHYPLWVRRTVPSFQAALSNDTVVLRIKGDTAG
ncbi:MAG: hypothetical protein OQK12_02725 [Motiliproteus sp.]|nr:hypothetical protein [Motiliproteus sp.]MCW9051243.1 hypothetical protein [Motiliproteus sp.]